MNGVVEGTGSYAEAGVKKKDTFGTIMARILMIALAVLLFLSAFIISWMMILATVLICIDILLIPLLKTEYEYIFCDGQLDFDRINGGARRKHILRIEMEEVELVAPQNSHALDSYRGNGTVKDFSSGQKNGRVYVIIMNRNGSLVKILFEPSEKMLACMKTKAPRKIIEV